MASIIPGYEYDIFISYRQKDNKYDGWVTEFVDHLKREVEATFKEDVSVYFDENPHDGLLEIHNVDKSLEIKLKSVIFIPIISLTYCDPKSFAWQNEFVAFNKLAGTDQLGRDIKLASGNVCSRIIPVKIHDLDASDTELIENEIGCRLRAIEFIYSSSGVNRPLKPADNPDKNLNKTFYRDQINKVANAIKDLIYGLHPDPKKRIAKSYQTSAISGYKEAQVESIPEKAVHKRHKFINTIIYGSLATLVLIALVVLLPQLFNKPKSEIQTSDTIKKAIAILPVSNFSGNSNLDIMASGIQDALITKLGQMSALIVRPMRSTLEFKNSNESIQQIAKKLSVNSIVESSIKGPEDSLQIEVRLVEAFPGNKVIWSSAFTRNMTNISSVYNEITKHIAEEIQINLTQQDKKKLNNVQKHNPEVIKACFRGKEYMSKHTEDDFQKGVKCYNEAIAIDPADPLPYVGLASSYGNVGHSSPNGAEMLNKAKVYAMKALELDSTIAEAYVVIGDKYLYNEWNFEAAEKSLRHAMSLNANIPSAHILYGWYLALKNKFDESVSEMKKALEIDPTDVVNQDYLAWLYFFFGHFEESIAEAKKSFLLDPNDILAYYLIGSSYAEMGMHYEAIEMHKKGLAISPGYESGLAIAYARAGQKDKALEVISEMEKYTDLWMYDYGLATVYAVLGDKNKAIAYIETVYKLHGDFLPWMKYDIYFKTLLDDPRFKEIVSRFNLPI
jgi:tetratricopeptide (TPR) repeat protein